MAAANQMPTELIVNPALTAISIVYKNPALVADSVCPRVTVDTPDFKYTVWNKTDDFSIPETLVGRKGYVNEVEISEAQATGSVEDHFIDAPLPRRDAAVAVAYNIPFDIKARKTQNATNRLDLSREQRVAQLFTTAANYPTGNKVTLSGTGQWSDFTNSDPLGAILDVFDTMLIRPNKGVVGRLVASKLVRHPKIIQAYHANDGAVGVAPLSFLAGQLGLSELVVGDSWYNTANAGQNSSLSRLWGKSASFFYQDPVSTDTESMSFAITAQWGTRMVSEYFDQKRGGRGTDVFRVGEATKELILAPDLGYLFQNAIA